MTTNILIEQFTELEATGYFPKWVAAGTKKIRHVGWTDPAYRDSPETYQAGDQLAVIMDGDLVAFDVDGLVNAPGRLSLADYSAEFEALFSGLNYLKTTSPTGGMHLILRQNPEHWLSQGTDVLSFVNAHGEVLKASLDVRAGNSETGHAKGYCLFPPSAHPGDVTGKHPWKDAYKGSPYQLEQLIPRDELSTVPETIVEIFALAVLRLMSMAALCPAWWRRVVRVRVRVQQAPITPYYKQLRQWTGSSAPYPPLATPRTTIG